jgi:hypothetical protein
MRANRYRDFMLTVIAVALCEIALPRLESPEAVAASRQPEEAVVAGPQQSVMSPNEEADPASRGPRAPTSTLPLRWRVSWAALETGDFDTWCSTAIAVANTTAAAVEVEVEWISSGGSSLALRPETVPGYQQVVWIPDTLIPDVNPVPWIASDTINPGIADFKGFALVTATDPRIMVSAFQYCRSTSGVSGAVVVAQTNIPAYPVGATMEYFQAGMPAAWTPPIAEPEVPEVPE